MNNAGQKIVVAGICRPDGAWLVGGVLATKMPLLTELGAWRFTFGILLSLFISAIAHAEPLPLVLTAENVKASIHKLPSYAQFSYSGLIFFKDKLYASSGFGLLEFEKGSLIKAYQWNKKDTDVEGPWLDRMNGLLWVWIPGGDAVANFDGQKWKTMQMPEPQNGLSRGNVLEGFRGIGNTRGFWLEGAWHGWKWNGKHWNEESNPPVLAENNSVILRRILPTDEHLYFIMFRDNELMYSDGELQQKQKGDAIYYFQDKWNEATNQSHFVFFAEQTVSAGKTGYIRTSRGDIMEVTNDSVLKLPTLGKCESITVSPSGSLVACFHNLGVYEFKNEWKLLFKAPYPLSEGEHWVHLAENNGQIAVSVSPVPQLVAEKNSSNYKTVYNSSAALWIFDGQKVTKVPFPNN
jgi:hypothetical protein